MGDAIEDNKHVRSISLTVQFTVRLHTESFQSYKCDPPSNEVDISKEELVDMYTKMVCISLYNTRALLMYLGSDETYGAGR
jgi:hypothetical protein